MKRPSFQFYPADWLRDTALRSCSIGARGLWMDMICFMHEGSPYGHLKVGNKVILASNLCGMVGSTLSDVEGWLSELNQAGVYDTAEDGSMFSRRMIKDENLRNMRAAGGKLGGNPALKDKDKVNLKDKQNPTPSSSSSPSTSLIKEPKGSSPVNRTPSQQLLELFHEKAQLLPRVTVFNEPRRKVLQARYREVMAEEKWTAEQTIDWFGTFYGIVNDSAFLTGRSQPGRDGRVFKADWDWIHVPKNFVKIVEGKYSGD